MKQNESLPATMRRTPTAEDIGLLAIQVEITRKITPAAKDCLLYDPPELPDLHPGTPPCRHPRLGLPNYRDWCQICKYRESMLHKTATARRKLREWIRRWESQRDEL